MFHNKRGMDLEIIVKAIPVIIMAGILLFVVLEFIKLGDESVDREACRDSILLKARTKTLGRPLIGEINCKTNLIEVENTEKEEIYGIITEEMYDCWYQFGEGKHDFLGEWDRWKGDNWCFVCSRIDYSDNAKKNVPELYLNDYLSLQKIPFTKDLTFFEYFYGENATLENFPEIRIKTSEPTYIVFFADKRLNKEWLINPTKLDSTDATVLGGGCASGAAIGALIGTVVPGAGNVAGAAIGCAGGTIIAGVTEIIFRKTDYLSGIYLGSSEKMLEVCSQ